MEELPTDWQAALEKIAGTPTNKLVDWVYLRSPVQWKYRRMVLDRFKRPQLIAQCFELWLHNDIKLEADATNN